MNSLIGGQAWACSGLGPNSHAAATERGGEPFGLFALASMKDFKSTSRLMPSSVIFSLRRIMIYERVNFNYLGASEFIYEQKGKVILGSAKVSPSSLKRLHRESKPG